MRKHTKRNHVVRSKRRRRHSTRRHIRGGSLSHRSPSKVIEIETSLGKYTGHYKTGHNDAVIFEGTGKMMYNNGDIYEGHWKDGEMEGKGKMTYVYGYFYEGDWKNNKMHGMGKMTFLSGNVYEGEWKNGVGDGDVIIIYKDETMTRRYEGEWKNNKIHGKGKMLYRDDVVYEGQWVNGKREGFGKIFMLQKSNENYFEGEWKNNSRINGIFIFNGNIFEGNVEDLKYGKITYKNGNIYEGELKSNIRVFHFLHERYNISIDKNGKMIFANGDIYEGEWEDERFHGKGKMTYKNGDVYEGQWIRGKKHGYGKMTFSHGKVLDGEWENDEYESNDIVFRLSDNSEEIEIPVENIPENNMEEIFRECRICLGNITLKQMATKQIVGHDDIKNPKEMIHLVHLDCFQLFENSGDIICRRNKCYCPHESKKDRYVFKPVKLYDISLSKMKEQFHESVFNDFEHYNENIASLFKL